MNQNKTLVYRAGTIPYVVENGEILMLFMKPSCAEFGGSLVETVHPDGTTTSEFVAKWQIAKGKVEETDETTKAAALREAKEEVGLFIGNVLLTEEVGVFMGRTTLFVVKVKDRDMFGSPGYETEDVAWLTENQFIVEGRSLHAPVVQAAVRMIKKLENME
jgi:ADP-ribose pyrophosphatase YjhB (NUDIX family)